MFDTCCHNEEDLMRFDTKCDGVREGVWKKGEINLLIIKVSGSGAVLSCLLFCLPHTLLELSFCAYYHIEVVVIVEHNQTPKHLTISHSIRFNQPPH